MTREHRARSEPQAGPLFRLGLFYLVFVVYGSLVPLDFREVPLAEAWSGFLGLPWADKGPFSWTDAITNVLLYAPLGLLGRGILAARGRGGGLSGAILTWLGCVALSAAIEFTQTFTVSRTPLFGDIVTNALGAALGLLLWPLARPGLLGLLAHFSALTGQLCPSLAAARLPAALGLAPYLGLLAWASGWLGAPWLPLPQALDRLAAVPLTPFYQDYFADIGFALRSVALVLAAFVPLGVGVWAGRRRATLGRTLLWRAAYSGMLVDAVLESGKLFQASRQPDYSDLLFAALGAALGALLACRYGTARPAPALVPMAPPESNPATVRAVSGGRGLGGPLLAAGALAAALAGLWDQPFARIPLAGAALLYVLLLVRQPQAWLVLVPALLPVLDLAPWSGRFFFDEFDLMLLLTLAVGYSRRHTGPRSRPRLPPGVASGLGLYGVLYIASLATALLPLAPPDLNAFAHPYSPYNPLRVAKGFFWALALLPLLLRQAREGIPVARLFTLGMTLGLAGEILAVLWERAVFPGLADVTRDFRAAGLMSSMNVGGSHIEAYLVLVLPFLAAYVAQQRTRWAAATAMALLLGGLYAQAVTFARGGYVATALVLLVLGAGWLLRGRPEARRRAMPYILAAGLLAGLVVAPILGGQFAQARLAQTSHDAGVRLAHWQQALDMRDADWWHALFGMGPGRYPVTYFFRSAPAMRPASFGYIDLGGHNALSLGAGTPLYVEQKVPVSHHVTYRLEISARQTSGNAKLNVMLCERTFFDSFGCASSTFALTSQWQNYQEELALNWPEGWGRPVTLSLENAGPGSVAEIQHIALLDPERHDVVSNGDFARGADRWYFSVFDHLAWHIKNLWVDVLFAQGWLGLAAFALLLGQGLVRITGRFLRGGDLFDLAILAGLLGFMTVGGVDSLFDAPRLTLLFFLTLLLGQLARDGGARTPATRPAAEPVAAAAAQSAEFEALADPTERAAPAAPKRRSMAPWRDLAWSAGLLAALALAVPFVPGMPYNARQLIYPSSPVVSAVAFSLFWFWFAGVPALLARQLDQQRNWSRAYLLAVPVHAAVAAWLLMQAAPSRNYHDIAGYPILGWPLPFDLETLARLTALFSVISLLLTVGAWIARALATRRLHAGAGALAAVAVPILALGHWIVIEKAATDNLVELMAGGGGLLSDTALSLCVVLLGTVGSLMARLAVGRGLKATTTLAWACVALPLSFGLLQLGTDTDIFKYGRHFSALQFLLSADRAHLASGAELAIRYGLAYCGGLAALAFAQRPWVGMASAQRPARRKRRARSGTPRDLPVE